MRCKGEVISSKGQSYNCILTGQPRASRWLVRAIVFYLGQAWTSPSLCPYLLSLLIVETCTSLAWPSTASTRPPSCCWDVRLIVLCVSSSVSKNWNGGLISERKLGSLLQCLLSPFKFHVESNKKWWFIPITLVILLYQYICRQIIAMGCRVYSSVILMLTYGHWFQLVWCALSSTCACADSQIRYWNCEETSVFKSLYYSSSWIQF